MKSSSLFSGSFIYLFANVTSAAIPFALLPILTRYLEPAEYGKVAIFQAFISSLTAFVGLNAVSAVARKYYDKDFDRDAMRSFIASCLQILLASTLIVTIIVWMLSDYFSKWLNLEVKWLLSAILVSAMMATISLRLVEWQVTKRAGNYGLLQVSKSATTMALSLLFVVAFKQGADGQINAQIWSTLLFALISLGLLKREKLLTIFNWNYPYIREILYYGVPLIPHVAGAFLLTSIDRFIINTHLGFEKAGIYMVAVQISLVFSLIFGSINSAYVPWLFERLKQNRDDEKRKIVIYTYTWYLLILAGVLVFSLIGPWFVTQIAGPKYSEAGSIIGFLALGQGFNGMYLMVTNYIFYSKRTGLLSLTTIVSGSLNALLIAFMIPLLGLRGAAISFCTAMAIRFLLTWWIAQNRHPMPWFSLKKSIIL